MRKLGLPVLMALELFACGDSTTKPHRGGSTALASALVAAVHFEDGQLSKGRLPSADPALTKVQLIADSVVLSIVPAEGSIMALDMTDPDEDVSPIEATLMQFSDADSYVRVPAKSKITLDDQSAVLHFKEHYSVDDDLCKNLCKKVYTTQIEVTAVLESGKASHHQKYDVRVDCSKKGDTAKCSSADLGSPDGGGGGVAGSGHDAGAGKGMSGTGMDAGIARMDAGSRTDAGSRMDAGNTGTGGSPATAGTGGTGGGGAGGGGTAGNTSDLDAGSDAASSTPSCDGGTAGSHIIMQFDPVNPERVTSLQWIDSTSTMSANLAANNAGTGCPGGNEFFGQAYGAPEGSPIAGGIGAGQKATLVQCGLETTVTLDPTDCSGGAQMPITTTYTLYAGARANEVRIERAWSFDANTQVKTGTGLRPYVPRVPQSMFSTVIYPNQAGTAVTSVNVGSCGGDCITATGSSWNGSWIADIAPSNGYAMIILRDPAMTSPVDFTINYDGSSASNLSSFVLVQPTSGWKAPITEVEYLCFEDLTSWPQVQRDAAQLPAGCGP